MIKSSIKLDISKKPEQINGIPAKDIAFFDIETTGFSPANTQLYLIGMAYLDKDNEYVVKQWFAEKPEDEAALINDFFSSLSSFKLLISYNGIGFDLSYLKEKCTKFNIPFCLDTVSHLDIYRQILPIKKFFKLENYKQKNIERFLGIHRDDIYNGGELINYYMNYLKSPDDVTREILLQHNSDDIKGMISILPILAYAAFFNGGFQLSHLDVQRYETIEGKISQEAIFELTPNVPLPKHISYGTGPLYLSGNGSKVGLKVSMHTGELKFFYSNYKDYYYLPSEDLAIHKSVAFYVDKNYRTQAKAATCYSKKTGRFLPQFSELIMPYFKIEYHDKITYFELTNDVYENDVLMKEYVLHCINYMK